VQSVIFILDGDYSAEDKEQVVCVFCRIWASPDLLIFPQALCVVVNFSNCLLGKEFVMTNDDVRNKILHYLVGYKICVHILYLQ